MVKTRDFLDIFVVFWCFFLQKQGHLLFGFNFNRSKNKLYLMFPICVKYAAGRLRVPITRGKNTHNRAKKAATQPLVRMAREIRVSWKWVAHARRPGAGRLGWVARCADVWGLCVLLIYFNFFLL